jgi:glutamate/tyrosine decarboxylase-like PLP-dependent enzyme
MAAPASSRAGLRDRVSAWIRRCQRQLSDWVHAAADERARAHGWQVTETTGRLGLGGRRYRDPRFDNRHAQLSHAAVQDVQRHHSAACGKEVKTER